MQLFIIFHTGNNIIRNIDYDEKNIYVKDIDVVTIYIMCTANLTILYYFSHALYIIIIIKILNLIRIFTKIKSK